MGTYDVPDWRCRCGRFGFLLPADYLTKHPDGCADAPTAENQYERTRSDRTPARERAPFKAKKPVTGT
ncbi:hypothetical protein [Kitasatospora purpeofusca]|uniref:hypothetical protein n=1 Tax=Kitasatospora purpeofusca TaxID=67352 RepID=UPI003F4AB017